MDLQLLFQAIASGNRKAAAQLTQQALDEGINVKVVLDTMIAAMDDVGGRFSRNEAFVPEMLIAARAMKECLAILEPLMVAAGLKPEITAVIGTVEGDLHDIGKNLVAMMWKGANFEVVDLGTNVPPERFIEAARDHKAQVVGLSALLTTTMPAMKTTVAAIREAGLDTKILIGGAPITRQFAAEIGADAYAADASGAVNAVREMLAA